MLSFLKPNPVKKKQKKYRAMLADAMQAQRRGDIKSYSLLTAEAEALWQEIETLQKQQ
ncbi:DUF6435 family protein [Echinimonas agarilytica]|uniref:DUF6435 family protein n=1 Tax=Echinimonas agarilytica TaxID=1215918 RepID=A0AA41W3L0_9GAMM|nr:DUF6435 family protein [Echinimonas agarilytica]MCM2678165.1 DUF6435 family protein [Echinimonas agarilytica]